MPTRMKYRGNIAVMCGVAISFQSGCRSLSRYQFISRLSASNLQPSWFDLSPGLWISPRFFAWQ